MIDWFVQLKEGARVEGVVLGPKDRPIADAVIRIRSVASSSWIDATKAAMFGRWAIRLPEGRFRIAASTATLGAVSEFELRSNGRTPTQNIVLRVGKRRRIRGRVADEDGRALSNAWVCALSPGGAIHHVGSDEDGQFELLEVSPGVSEIYAQTWEKASAVQRVPTVPRGRIGRLLRRIRRGESIPIVAGDARITGEVIDEAGRSLVGASVELRPSICRPGFAMELATDAAGHFDFGATVRGNHTIRAAPQSSLFKGWSDRHVVRPGNAHVKLSLPSRPLVTGRVVMDGIPVPEYGLEASRRQPFQLARTVVRDPAGCFILRDLEPGTWRISIVGPAIHRKVVDAIAMDHSDEVHLGDIAVERSERVAGRVHDQASASVPGARVFIGRGPEIAAIRSRFERWFSGDFETTTDKCGLYEFASGSVSSDEPRPLIWAKHPRRGASLIRELPPRTSRLDFELVGSGCIEGKVHGVRGGSPIVVAQRDDERIGARRQVVSDTGQFAFTDAPAGNYEIALSVPSSVSASVVNATVTEGSTVTVEIVMSTPCVRLVINVAEGRGQNLLLASEDEDMPGLEPTYPRIIAREARIEIAGRKLERRSSRETVTFDFVLPGKYRASLDGRNWTPVLVLASPELQVIDID